MTKLKANEDRAIACLLAGAAGDALGAPVEFLDRPQILQRFGPGGIRDYAPAYGGIGKITDDTQMTLFTAEGCLRALRRDREADMESMRHGLHQAYLRWLMTQSAGTATTNDSWLLQQPQLYARRAPGNTCLSALSRKGGERNNSKGCGGVMRVAPCGLLYPGQAARAFNLGVEAAKLTHGHPTGYLAAGAFAAIIAGLVIGAPLNEAIADAGEALRACPDHEETLHALDGACHLAATGVDANEAIPELGEGWVAEEALAIAVYCALTARTLEEGIVTAVNITGDSDSTGAMAGNLLGAMYGIDAIPNRWLKGLELRDVIETVARDLVRIPQAAEQAGHREWLTRYPEDRF
ncbi:ADP-ribosylglycohydrolase family protein [Noviherbaspirillum pedocola]|uniref:ADP-ribosylglycohydrolase family protein n=1 Tax=Noviherbaspirillum pedocola TaxID=2801341 RepID=A0A934T2D7_9BURK|nr:ADP-ribosylglycohydrolase family protein [Noviherbaspirillum pedocola]MBK4737804.1 ADP-ribosylglycohydrolase family protein [Noviherbaspirillum pedocola]